jgi:hypothetical protein
MLEWYSSRGDNVQRRECCACSARYYIPNLGQRSAGSFINKVLCMQTHKVSSTQSEFHVVRRPKCPRTCKCCVIMIDHHVSHAARRSATYLNSAWTLGGDVNQAKISQGCYPTTCWNTHTCGIGSLMPAPQITTVGCWTSESDRSTRLAAPVRTKRLNQLDILSSMDQLLAQCVAYETCMHSMSFWETRPGTFACKYGQASGNTPKLARPSFSAADGRNFARHD